MRIEVRFVADVHKIKGVEYLDRQTGRNATSWRLILDYGDDTGEIKCMEEIAKTVKRGCRYEFLASVDPMMKESNFRIVGIAANMGYPDNPFDDEEYDKRADAAMDQYVQQELAIAAAPTGSAETGTPAGHDASQVLDDSVAAAGGGKKAAKK